MTTLLLRLAGPMQSWGTQSRFEYRDTGHEPSKSGVVGIAAAALGRPRTADVADLDGLLMGVRVNMPGVVQRDYHTVGGVHRGSGRTYGVAQFDGSLNTIVSRRSYLADADFLVGLAATTPEQEALLDHIDAALASPVWPLFLGRKAFVPGKPIRLPDGPPLGPGRRDLPLDEALQAFPWPRDVPRLRFIYEDTDEIDGEQRLDRPLSFANDDRRYLPRFVRSVFVSRPADAIPLEEVDL